MVRHWAGKFLACVVVIIIDLRYPIPPASTSNMGSNTARYVRHLVLTMSFSFWTMLIGGFSFLFFFVQGVNSSQTTKPRHHHLLSTNQGTPSLKQLWILRHCLLYRWPRTGPSAWTSTCTCTSRRHLNLTYFPGGRLNLKITQTATSRILFGII